MSLSDHGPYPASDGYQEAIALDREDPLANHRDRYARGDSSLIYLDGNSLGRLPQAAIPVIEDVTERQWGDRLIRSWNEGWWELQVRLGDKLAPLVGAGPGEVILSDSTSVNLYKLAMGAMGAADEGRSHIVTDDLNFPSDVYILESVARSHGGDLQVVASDGVEGPVGELNQAIGERTALVSLSHTAFKSGYTYDMTEITDMAHRSGAMILWDCSHSVGAIPIDFERSGVDLAIGCTYKYLNGGPGSPAFLYVRSEHQERLENPITGWWGHRSPFDFDLEFTPIDGIRRFHSGTMPILSLAAIEPGLDDVLDAGSGAIRSKSRLLTSYAVDQWRRHLAPLGFGLASPREPERRGPHVALGHEMAWAITRAMIEDAHVIPDFRAPDNIRLGLPPLYTSYADVHTAIQRIKLVVTEEAYLAHLGDDAVVT
ncbi:MAG: aminotransferase class V-fold PLP-dependent enzyme [Acidimicrobiia bacterium]